MSQLTNYTSLLISAICLLTGVASQGRDDTLRDRATGKDVVEAVLRKISKSAIFPEDNSFLIRLAYVESHFGNDGDTFRPNYYGGLWQVDRWIFDQTHNASLADLHDKIEDQFNISWSDIIWNNLTTPMHSGLAAALFFAELPDPIPQTIAEQAAHWKKYYRTEGDVNKFIEESEDLRNQTRCRGKMDLAIVLDSSGSINQGDPMNYDRAKNFTAEVIESFTLDFTRIGMLVYSNIVRDTFTMRESLTIPQMSQRARDAVYINDGTRTDLGINRAIAMFNEVVVIQGVPKILMVLTDGNSNQGSDLPGAVRNIRNNNVTSISVGIGNGINRAELLLIALDNPNNVFQLDDFTNLQDFLFQLTSVTCDIPQKPEVNGTYEDSLEQNEKRIYQMELPVEGITITVDVFEGDTVGFWSYTEEVPSSALHDGILAESTYIPVPRRLAKSGATLYFAIQGVETMNNYTISAEEGNTVEDWTTTEDYTEETTTDETTVATTEETTTTEDTATTTTRRPTTPRVTTTSTTTPKPEEWPTSTEAGGDGAASVTLTTSLMMITLFCIYSLNFN